MSRTTRRSFSLIMLVLILLTSPAPASLAQGPDRFPASSPDLTNNISLSFLGRYAGSGAEISAYDPGSKRLFVTGPQLQIVDISNPASPALVSAIAIEATSVAVKNGIIAAAVPANPVQDPGQVLFLSPDGAILNTVTVGTLPMNPNPEPVLLGLVRFNGPAGLDASDNDGDGGDKKINIQPWPVFGMHMPDGIAAFSAGGQTFYATANAGDARSEPARIATLNLDPTTFPNAADLQNNAALGRLNASTIDGDVNGDGDYDQLYTYGARSFTIWDAAGNVAFDSGDAFEQITAAQTPALFNASDGVPAKWDERSDDNGPEPEGITVGTIAGRPYAFIGLERAGGGVLVYDLGNPRQPLFQSYVRTDGDIAPEGLTFIPAQDSPTGSPLLVVTNEVSNTTSIYEVRGPIFGLNWR